MELKKSNDTEQQKEQKRRKNKQINNRNGQMK